jgi:superfamily II DNA or RNA helicase
LEHLYTGNDARADLVVRSVWEKLVDPLQARGLGFCVSVAHAAYMAGYFRRCGIPAEALSGESASEVRRTV